jgi:hypothetical protein
LARIRCMSDGLANNCNDSNDCSHSKIFLKYSTMILGRHVVSDTSRARGLGKISIQERAAVSLQVEISVRVLHSAFSMA